MAYARDSQAPRSTVWLCTRNEVPDLGHVLPAIPSRVDEMLLVDGNSSDNTGESGCS